MKLPNSSVRAGRRHSWLPASGRLETRGGRKRAPRRRPLAAVGTLSIAVVLAAGLAASNGGAVPQASSPVRATIAFVDVAQGDAVVMKIGGTVIVSDVGEHRVENVDAALRAVGAKRIDVAILTHPHDDHVQNLAELIEGYGWTVKQAVLSESAYWQGTKTNRRIMSLLGDRNIKRDYVAQGDVRKWGGAEWRILSPPKGSFIGGKPEAANASIVYLLRVNGVEALFTGDIERKVAKQVATYLGSLAGNPVEIFLATHHGSKEGSIDELLDVIHPVWAVLSTGDNTYEHPSPDAIARLKRIGASIWCTDVNGTITATITPAGKLTWKASGPPTVWWSAKKKKQLGHCVGT